MKLPDERVREILAIALAGDGGSDLGWQELASLAQEVLDLRTANAALETALTDAERSPT